VLWQPLELVMIFGAAIGAFFVGNTPKAVKATMKALPTVFKGSKFNRDMYMELMSLLFDVLSKVRKEGLMSIEGDIESPERARCSRNTRPCWPTTTLSNSSPITCA
jgi:chemotaxis protein MotA